MDFNEGLSVRKTLTLLVFLLIITGISTRLLFQHTQTASPESEQEQKVDTPEDEPPLTEKHPTENKTSEKFEKADVDLEAKLVPIGTWYPDTGKVLYGDWFRGDDDLPYFNSSFSIYVYNHGKKIAHNVSILVADREEVVFNETKNFWPAYSYKKTILGIPMRYDDSHGLYLYVKCSENDPEIITVFAYFNIPWNRFNPTIRPDMTRFYITPLNPDIRDTVSHVVEDTGDGMGVLYWVNNNIKHESNNMWLLGHETLSDRKGDDIDKAILACSIFRSIGWGPDDVYVGLSGGDRQKAWVLFKEVDANRWRKVYFGEDLVVQVLPSFNMSKTEAEILFNDIHFERIVTSK